MKGENGTSKRERERNQDSPGCQTFPYHVRNREKPGVFVRFAYFFSPSFSFSNASRKQTATTAPFQPVNRLFFHDGGAEKPSNDHVKRKQLSCARASRRIMRIISRENSLISLRRNELEDDVIRNDEEIPLIPPFSKINETYPNTIAI